MLRRLGQEMAATREETLECFLTKYRKILEENLDDYIRKFESYMN